MDSKTRKQLQEKLKQRTHLLPSVFQQFLEENRSSLSLGSRYEYAKDFHLFTDYLRKVFSEEVDDQLIIHLEKQDYQNFLAKIYRHTRSFQTTANQETEQLFENSYYRLKAFKQAEKLALKKRIDRGTLQLLPFFCIAD